MSLEDGMTLSNFERAHDLIASLGYDGPIAAATDQTVCVKSLQHHDGCLVGAQGGDVRFESGEDIERLIKEITTDNRLCSKVCTILVFIIFIFVVSYIPFLPDLRVHHSNPTTKCAHICCGAGGELQRRVSRRYSRST